MVFHHLFAFAIVLVVVHTGCGSPTPTAVNTGPPPPPPIPAPEPKPARPPAKPQPGPYELAMREVGAIIERYGKIYAEVRDEATADKVIGEIGKMTARLRELATEINKLPIKPGDDKHALALQNNLVQMQTAQLTNQDLQRVLSDPDLGLKFIAAHQSFVTEGLLPVGQSVASRQSSAPAEPSQPAQPQPAPASQP